ncbi:anthranilate phosphoribosyltransferase [Weizmannia acidilactici]|uniref:Anthranilate phosphoribosyltransferase n=1 Tax=Weizmannia acidilactici TaxID=2607726 RepID=A0A5J4JGP0_9BACI|nr:anthranilate phosphoribosyltransferase [Weizmannia acidilactici]GER67160.1 anthranilate phosphoribosyltransferase [Weizmannia acidilactici]GER69670.1 anthranilate phosphoribosyltransferase [Weizmannia acidilactici]GER72509.1 anthranilate phosphoribosyltransferase [Weizmannia acidilactici]
MKPYLEKILSQKGLTFEEMREASRALFSDEVTEGEKGAFLATLRFKGETAEEIAGLVEVIREKAVSIPCNVSGLMDNCGTGGDGSHSFNISSTSAFVLAGAGIKVAKHGNRSVSSQTGSADVLEKLGISLSFPAEEIESLLEKIGIVFLFAPNVHPALKKIMKIRKDLRIPTIFNLIGPLTNPMNLETQLLGLYRRDKLVTMAEVLGHLGRKRALVVNGAGYLDEASLSGENHLALLDGGRITTFTLLPEDVGLPYYSNEAIRGGDAQKNSEILLSVLKGEKGPYRDTVLFNAGLAIFASGKAETVKEGIKIAQESIDSGAALEKLRALRKASSNVAREAI